MATVNEKSPFNVNAVFKDADGNDLVPTTVEYRVDNITAGTEVLDWSAAGVPAASMTITIPGSNHVIADQDNISETFRVTIRVDDGLPGEAYQDMQYKVVNLKKTETAD